MAGLVGQAGGVVLQLSVSVSHVQLHTGAGNVFYQHPVVGLRSISIWSIGLVLLIR